MESKNSYDSIFEEEHTEIEPQTAAKVNELLDKLKKKNSSKKNTQKILNSFTKIVLIAALEKKGWYYEQHY